MRVSSEISLGASLHRASTDALIMSVKSVIYAIIGVGIVVLYFVAKICV